MEITTIIEYIQTAGFTGLLIVLAIPKLKKRFFGNGNGDITDLHKHAEVANKEMGQVKANLVEVNTKLDIIMRHLKL